MMLHEDGRVTVQMGATEIGQGADTVFTQMAAESIGLPVDAIDIQSVQDTDVSPLTPALTPPVRLTSAVWRAR